MNAKQLKEWEVEEAILYERFSAAMEEWYKNRTWDGWAVGEIPEWNTLSAHMEV